MKANHEKLCGAFLPINTPFKADMTVDYDALKENMSFYAKSGIHGYLALGSNAENRCLFEDEKCQILDIILENKAPEQVVMTGCIYDSTIQTVQFMKFAKQAGSDFATLLTPCYFRAQMDDATLLRYFTECAESVDLPVLLYNAPQFTGVAMNVELIERLSRHNNIWGIKNSAPTGVDEMIHLNSNEFCVMAGSASFFYPSMTKGLRGGVVSLANIRPEIGITLWQNGMRGQDEEGMVYHERMKLANKQISGTFGVPGVKAAMDLIGLNGGYPRLPLQKLNEEQYKIIKDALIEAQLLNE